MTICWKSQTCFQWWVHFHLFKRMFAREKLILQVLALFAKAHLDCKPLKMLYNHPACFNSCCENIPKDRKGQLFSIFLFICFSCKNAPKCQGQGCHCENPLKGGCPASSPLPDEIVDIKRFYMEAHHGSFITTPLGGILVGWNLKRVGYTSQSHQNPTNWNIGRCSMVRIKLPTLHS